MIRIDDICTALKDYKYDSIPVEDEILDKTLEVMSVVKVYLSAAKSKFASFKWNDGVIRGEIQRFYLYEKENGSVGLGFVVSGIGNNIYNVPYEDITSLE